MKWVSCVAREADEVEALMREPVKGPAARDAERDLVVWRDGGGREGREA